MRRTLLRVRALRRGAFHNRRARRPRRAVREAADSTDERVCTHLVVPAPARPVVAPYGELLSISKLFGSGGISQLNNTGEGDGSLRHFTDRSFRKYEGYFAPSR